MNLLKPSVMLVLVACATAFSAHAQEVRGDAKAGQKKVAMCIGCHGIAGYQATFPEVYRVPKIAGQGAKYIVSALTAYKKGERRHPTMRGMADNLTEQDMADLGAYYESLAQGVAAPAPAQPPQNNPRVAALLAKGACVTCHGDNFSKPVDPSFPKIAGQHGDYLFVALKSYKTEGQATWGRGNPVMGGVAKQFSNAELKELASYVAALPGQVQTIPQPGFIR